MANNNYPQITSVTSETLQAQIRNLLPSQQGFGTDLMAQNVIVPIIDLTAAAEGSTVGQNLQTAIAFGSQTAFDVQSTTTVIANTAGFWRMTCGVTNVTDTVSIETAELKMSDGLSTKTVWALNGGVQISQNFIGVNLDYTFFLDSGDSLSWDCSSYARAAGSIRQIADINGVLVNPSGFSPQ